MATTTASRAVTDHAVEATSWLNAYVGHPEDLSPAELFAYAQVHATLAVAQATERNTEAAEQLIKVAEDILGEMPAPPAAERPVYNTQHRGYSVVAGRLIPGLWAVDIYWTLDPEHGEGPASFWSWGWPDRAMRRGIRFADQLADQNDYGHPDEVA